MQAYRGLMLQAQLMHVTHLGLQDDGHNDSINSHSLAEDDTGVKYERDVQYAVQFGPHRSQRCHLIKFLLVMRGTRIEAPTKLLPVV